ncbi:hypothetical protein EYF80_036600 [Liparis tanakae]|uniref:Uncharacterized protein n=1 Tax=Liparis tanakae TaxID=230148 RepID=A0A4Z2GJ10_9TELE|nr:hypothetical protein EYF80_036600 [Liparis tanakae]
MQPNNPTRHFIARCPRGQAANVRRHRGQVDSNDNRGQVLLQGIKQATGGLLERIKLKTTELDENGGGIREAKTSCVGSSERSPLKKRFQIQRNSPASVDGVALQGICAT